MYKINLREVFKMTSEILILTPSAVALAADSAVTVGNKKTYNGVNKLFMLSNDPPMGIMTYNLATFSNIPMETLIKEFKKEMDKNLKTVVEFRDCFEKFLKKLVRNPRYTHSFEKQLNEFIKNIRDEAQHIDDSMFVNIVKNVAENVDLMDLEYSDEIIKKLNENEFKLIKLIPNSITEEKEEFLENLKKFFVFNVFIDSFSGIVIAGFDEDKLFPSYIEFNIHYLFDEKFISKHIKDFNIKGNQVHIRPLAQGDVINTFLSSIDEFTQSQIVNYFDNIHKDYVSNIKNALEINPNLTDDEKKEIFSEISKIQVVNDNLTNSFNRFINNLKKDHSKPILNSISALPKDELSNLVESLIKITSIKRKVQNDLETVGGPVDVAIITKGDGFIWTKRKHYFEGDLNPQFFKRE